MAISSSALRPGMTETRSKGKTRYTSEATGRIFKKKLTRGSPISRRTSFRRTIMSLITPPEGEIMMSPGFLSDIRVSCENEMP